MKLNRGMLLVSNIKRSKLIDASTLVSLTNRFTCLALLGRRIGRFINRRRKLPVSRRDGLDVGSIIVREKVNVCLCWMNKKVRRIHRNSVALMTLESLTFILRYMIGKPIRCHPFMHRPRYIHAMIALLVRNGRVKSTQ